MNLKTVNGSITGEKNAFGMRELVTALIQLRATKTLDARQADASRHVWCIAPKTDWAAVKAAYEKRAHLAEALLQQLFALVKPQERIVEFSTHELLRRLAESELFSEQTSLKDVEATLLYLHRIQVIRLISGFAVLYLPITIERLVLENKRQFRREDYAILSEHYQQRVQQVHIVGEYANLMIKNADEALRYVADYFQLDVRAFTKRWFAGRTDELSRHMTRTRANRVLNSLSDAQRAVLESKAQHIVVAAGPGSGKTRVLVHKLAHLLLEENVKPEELLVLTFSRAAANEFKQRLIKLYGPAALGVEIRTFHAYAFDVLGRLGTLDDADGVVVRATEAIEAGEVEQERLAKAVLVLDEAQDMSQAEYDLVCALMRASDGMRVIAVGDDDQNIFAFRGSSSVFMMRLLSDFEAERHELLENYRSDSAIVQSAESFIAHLPGRLKTDPCRSVTKQTGRVRLKRVVGTGPLERAAVHSAHEVLSELAKQPSGGSTAILVPTNESAGVIVGILWEEGVAATLIQSTSQCRFSDLLEVQWLLRALERRLGGEATVSLEHWRALREDFDRRFAKSRWAPNVDRLLDSLESVTDPCERFVSDVVEFLTESRLEDTFPPQARRVTVSTYHKAKGKEFDRVILVAPSMPSSPEEVRAMYVAITRARHELVIVTREARLRAAFSQQAPIEIEEDAACYPPVSRLLLSTSLRDVNLGRFKGAKGLICRRLMSGMSLVVRRYGFEAAGVGRFTYSAAFLRDRLEPLLSRGYVVAQARVNFIVRWHNQDDDSDEAIVLPMLTLERRADARETPDVT